MKYFFLGFTVKTIASFDDTLVRIPIISALTSTKEGKIAFSLGTMIAVSGAIFFAYLLSHLIEFLSFAHILSALFIYMLAIFSYFDLLTAKALVNREKRIVETASKTKVRFVKLLGAGFLISLLTLIDDIVVLIPLYLDDGSFLGVTLGIYLAAMFQIVIALYFAEKAAKLPYKKEMTVASLMILAFLVLFKVI